MGWRDDLIDRHQRHIDQMREGIDWMERGIQTHGEISASGELTDLTQSLIDSNKRTIAELEEYIERLKAD